MIDIKSLSRTPETKLYQDNSGRKKNHRLATQHTKCRKDKRIEKNIYAEVGCCACERVAQLKRCRISPVGGMSAGCLGSTSRLLL